MAEPNPLQKIIEGTLTPVYEFGMFPVELRCRVVEHEVVVGLFGHEWNVFGGAELIFPSTSGEVHYELVDEHHRSGEVFNVYRKYSNQRRVMETSGMVVNRP